MVRPNEAASFPLPPASTNGALSVLPQEGLSWAGLGASSPRGRLLGEPVHVLSPIWDLPNSMGATVGVGAAFDILGRAAGGQRVSAVFSRPTLLAVGAATFRPASHAGGTRGHGASQSLRPHCGCFPGPMPSRLGCGILGVMTWISSVIVAVVIRKKKTFP